MYRSLFPRDVFAELDRFQRDIRQTLDGASPSIRGIGRGGYPAINVGGTPQSVEIYAFAPGLDPDKIELNLERGVLTISGEREATPRNGDAKIAVHIDERFTGRFRRVLSLPDDIDPGTVDAAYRDGVLHISIKRRASAQPRRIEIK
jgi:HSP20 family protein